MATKAYSVRLRSRGQLTIPQEVREELATGEGDLLTLVQVEDDFILLAPRELRVPRLQARFTEEMIEAGVSLADLLEGLAEERQASQRQAEKQQAEEGA